MNICTPNYVKSVCIINDTEKPCVVTATYATQDATVEELTFQKSSAETNSTRIEAGGSSFLFPERYQRHATHTSILPVRQICAVIDEKTIRYDFSHRRSGIEQRVTLRLKPNETCGQYNFEDQTNT